MFIEMAQLYDGSDIGFYKFISNETAADDDRRDSDAKNGEKSSRFNVREQLRNSGNVTDGRVVLSPMSDATSQTNARRKGTEGNRNGRKSWTLATEELFQSLTSPKPWRGGLIERERERENDEIARNNKMIAERLSNIKSTVPNCR